MGPTDTFKFKNKCQRTELFGETCPTFNPDMSTISNNIAANISAVCVNNVSTVDESNK